MKQKESYVMGKIFEDYFSKNLKITQSLDTNQPKTASNTPLSQPRKP